MTKQEEINNRSRKPIMIKTYHYAFTFSEELRAYCMGKCDGCSAWKDCFLYERGALMLPYEIYKAVPKQKGGEVLLGLGCTNL